IRVQGRIHLLPGRPYVVAARQALIGAGVDDFGPPWVGREHTHHGIRMHALVNPDALPGLPTIVAPHHALANGADENGRLFHSQISLTCYQKPVWRLARRSPPWATHRRKPYG